MTSTAVSTNAQLAKILEHQGLLPIDVIDGLVARARTLQEWLGKVAADDRLVSYEELALAISRDTRIPTANLASLRPVEECLALVSPETCRSQGIIPLRLTQNTLQVAMANPLDEGSISSLRSLTNFDITPLIAPLTAILATIDKWYTEQVQANIKAAQTDERVIARIFADLQRTPTGDSHEASAGNPHDLSIDHLLHYMFDQHSSDLHLAVGSPPIMRVHGDLLPMPFPVLTPSSVQQMVYAILTDIQITEFERKKELDFAYSIPKMSRFRVNVHRQRGSVGAVLRTIPDETPTLENLKMPAVLREMTTRPRGLVLVTGPTGSGKSTTLAAMTDEINRTRHAHIITIEDPIEFLHANKLSVVTQREVGSDTESFAVALRHVLRQDPDVILIGEMRDLETISAAITAAETGHLVFATLHTTSAAQTIERIIDVFPPHQQEQIRGMLSNTLEAIFTQTLLLNIDGKGRSCAQEILVCTPAIRNLIREGKVHQMTSVMQASARHGMQTLDTALKQLVLSRKVSLDEAILKSSNPDDFKAFVAMQ